MLAALLRISASAMGALFVLGCAQTGASGPAPPREIRTGAAATASQYVEPGVSEAEIAAAIQTMISAEPVCASWPTLWLQDTTRRTLFIARYDLMARDWGPEIAAASLARMDEFVASGFLESRQREDIGPGAIEYTLTAAGDAVIQGSPYSGQRPVFCPPSERRLAAITLMEWGQFPCGNLRVRFAHVSDGWPSWARTEATRARLAETWPPPGAEAEGVVTLSRRWYSEPTRNGEGRGELASMCYVNGRLAGDDFALFAADEP